MSMSSARRALPTPPTYHATRRPRQVALLAPALLGALLVAGALFPAAALSQGGQARMTITSFSQDRAFSAGGFRGGSVSALCRRGFALLGTRFTVTGTSANLFDPRNRPVIGVVGAIPTPSGVTLRLRQFGGGPALVRATADCAKVTGKVRNRVARSSAADPLSAQASAKKKKKKPVRLSTYIAKTQEKVKRTRAAGTESVRATCDRRNSIPSDLGFDSNGATFGGASFFQRKGRIGVNATFNTDGKDNLKLFVVCQQGQRLNLNGRVGGAGRSARASSAPRAGAAAKKRELPGLTVRYGQLLAPHRTDVPFPGADAFVDETPRAFWANPVPSFISPGVLWLGRGLVAPAGSANARTAGAPASRAPGDVNELLTAMAFLLDAEEGDITVSLLGHADFGEIARQRFLRVQDERIPLLLDLGFTPTFGDPPGDGTPGDDTGGDQGGDTDGGGDPDDPFAKPTSKTTPPEDQPAYNEPGNPFVDEDGLTIPCDPGFTIDVFVPANTINHAHQILLNDPPCPGATVTGELITSGPVIDGKQKWTYRVTVTSSANQPPDPFRVRVTWEYPPSLL